MSHSDDDLEVLYKHGLQEMAARRTAMLASAHKLPARNVSSRNAGAFRRLRLGGAVIATLVLGAIPAYAAGRATAAPTVRTGSAVASPGETLVQNSPALVQQAIAWALSNHTDVLRVDRVRVKLVTFRDFERTWSTDAGHCGQGSDYGVVAGRMWVVALSGDFLTPAVAPKPAPSAPAEVAYAHTHWAALFIPTTANSPEASPRFYIANFSDANGDWPPCFGALTDASQ
jgi:hypothetical protein